VQAEVKPAHLAQGVEPCLVEWAVPVAARTGS
jgi:hypothetical protein